VASQVNLHKKYGGVFPEMASRAHTEAIIPVIERALSTASVSTDRVDAIAVTIGPGLIGSLLIGVNTAISLAYALGKPLIPVNHLEGHIYANFIANPHAPFPILALTVAGGHTQLVMLTKHLTYQVLGKTRDDSAGEAFDKVAKLLGLGYPGGPIVEHVARYGDPKRYEFPRGMLNDPSYDFSFSGLKTAVLYQTQALRKKEVIRETNHLAASFQQSVVDVLVGKTIRAVHQYRPRSIFLSGGVAANTLLRRMLQKAIEDNFPGTLFAVPEFRFCTDNAAMIGTASLYRAQAKEFVPWERVGANPHADLETWTKKEKNTRHNKSERRSGPSYA
jgi:N6-L-threonylcarbamoyladenine synthase